MDDNTSAVIVMVVAIIAVAVGVMTYQNRQVSLREHCIENGGSVVDIAGNFQCVAKGAQAEIQAKPVGR